MRHLFKLSRVSAGVILGLACLCSRSALSSPLELKAPSVSTDGTFVLRLSANQTATTKVELFRNINGGEFQKIADAPLFSSLSQIIFENGTYGYKVRLKNAEDNEFSSPVFVKVDSNHSQMPLRKPKESLSANL